MVDKFHTLDHVGNSKY